MFVRGGNVKQDTFYTWIDLNCKLQRNANKDRVQFMGNEISEVFTSKVKHHYSKTLDNKVSIESIVDFNNSIFWVQCIKSKNLNLISVNW